MTRHDRHEPLTPEERDLEERLGRSDASPPPALDAAILAAAREAVSAHAAPRPDAALGAPAPADAGARPSARRRRRWPVGLGIAASLLVAVGVAWQLRPLPDTRTEVWSEAPERTDPMQTRQAQPAPGETPADRDVPAREEQRRFTEALPAAAVESRDVTAPARMTDTESTPPTAPEPPTDALKAPAPAAGTRPAPQPAPPQTPAPAAVADGDHGQVPPSADARTAAPETAIGHVAEPSPATPPARTQALSAAPAAFPAQAGKVHERAKPALAAGSQERAARVVAPPPPPAPAPAQASQRDAAVAAQLDVDQGDENQPPASADSPQVREAWLARVRELLAAGDVEAARDSLAEFHRRYPQAELSPDLRALLD